MHHLHQRKLNAYEKTKCDMLMLMYNFSEIISSSIVIFGSDMNNKMVSHWFVDSVASFIAKQTDVTDENIDAHLFNFAKQFIHSFGEVPPKPIEKSAAEETRQNAYFLLDWSSRHLKKMQKELDASFSPIHYGEVCYYWGILYSNCQILKIPILAYCKETYIPYKRSNESYTEFFTIEPNDPHYVPNIPMLPNEYFYPIIERLENTKKI